MKIKEISDHKSKLVPLGNRPLLSVCIPAHNEEGNIGRTIDVIHQTLEEAAVPHEFVIANDNSKDNTEEVVLDRLSSGVPVRLINRTPPGGYGRAVRSCLDHVQGEILVIVMADLSDEPKDIIKYYDKLCEGYDAVFGSRFRKGSVVKDYPRIKYLANRLGNKLIQALFRTRFNDLTNAFKGFRTEAVRSVAPFYSSHFNLTIEISLSLLIRDFRIAEVPINWYGRTWGRANFKIATLSRRYFATLLKIYSERIFILDDVISEHDVKLEEIKPYAKPREQIIDYRNFDEKNANNRRGGIRGV
jgi:dolichol-phosphate mannosyltransferase